MGRYELDYSDFVGVFQLQSYLVLLILLLASLTHCLKSVVLTHYYLYMMKSCYNPPVSHCWDRSTYWRLCDLIKGIFKHAICLTLLNTTMTRPQGKKKKKPTKKLYESLYLRNALFSSFIFLNVLCVRKPCLASLKPTIVQWHSSV